MVVILLLETEAGEAQVAVEVITTLTTWPFVRPVLVNTGLFVPTLVVPIFH